MMRQFVRSVLLLGLASSCILGSGGCAKRTGGAKNLFFEEQEPLKRVGGAVSLATTTKGFHALWWTSLDPNYGPYPTMVSQSSDGESWETTGEVCRSAFYASPWTNNLVGHQNSLFAIVPGAPKKGASHLLFLSKDQGESWKEVESFPSMSGFPLLDGGSDTVYALVPSGDGGALAQSNDGGETWIEKRVKGLADPPAGFKASPNGKERSYRWILVDERDNIHLFRADRIVTTASGGAAPPVLYLRSEDGGSTWTRKLLGQGTVDEISVAENAKKPERLGFAYLLPAEGGEPGNVEVGLSHDGGESWDYTVITSGESTAPRLHLNFAMEGDLLVVTWTEEGGALVSSSRDGGQTWSKEHRFGDGGDRPALAVRDGRVIYLRGYDGDVHCTVGTLIETRR